MNPQLPPSPRRSGQRGSPRTARPTVASAAHSPRQREAPRGIATPRGADRGVNEEERSCHGGATLLSPTSLLGSSSGPRSGTKFPAKGGSMILLIGRRTPERLAQGSYLQPLTYFGAQHPAAAPVIHMCNSPYERGQRVPNARSCGLRGMRICTGGNRGIRETLRQPFSRPDSGRRTRKGPFRSCLRRPPWITIVWS